MDKSEKEKMIAGELYDASDPQLVTERMRASDLCRDLSWMRPSDLEARKALLEQLLPHAGAGLFVTPPFFCDYGWNIRVGRNFYCNSGCVILDPAPVSIGDDVKLGPGVHIYTAAHAIDPEARARLEEFARPVSIGNMVWIGGNATLCPGVSIGGGSIVGAGSVVTKDIPAMVIAAGNPCRVIRAIV
ncbi:sugar O-acetyltransferase [Desulfovibrio sp. OttesenSCG-928-G11]|nr:sugar O-acetyltransferase [Desulfovibrio sp. OttesenSCG-928-G11]